MMLPAVTFNPSMNFARAKSRASTSVRNVLVRRGCRRFNNVPSGGTSKVTYHVCFMQNAAGLVSPVLRAGLRAMPQGGHVGSH